VPLEDIESVEVQKQIADFNAVMTSMEELSARRVSLRVRYDSLLQGRHENDPVVMDCDYQIKLLNVELEEKKLMAQNYRAELRHYRFAAIVDNTGREYFITGDKPAMDVETGGKNWRLKVGNSVLPASGLAMAGGGAVVGAIPEGLPAIKIPVLDASVAFRLLPMAMIISLLGFMEAISIAKAMAAKTGQRLDVNQELIGQGLSNIIGSFGQSYAVSGSFSRSAVNFQAGAVSGLSNAISSLVVMIVLLFFTPLLYYLPQAVLAAIIMMAVVGLISPKAFIHAWKAQWYDGVVGIVTFICTLIFAPHLDRGIIIGVILSLLFYLIRNMKPAMAMLSLHADGSFRNQSRFNLTQCPHVAVIRYGGSLIFSNVSYLETQIIETVRRMPELRHVIIVGNGINEMDASGADVLSVLIDRLHSQRIKLSISGVNDAVMDVLKRTALTAKIGENNFYYNVARAIDNIWEEAHAGSKEVKCPLRDRTFHVWQLSDESRDAIKPDIDEEMKDKPDNPHK